MDAQPPESPPAIVQIVPSQNSSYFDGIPSYEQDGKKIYVGGVAVTAEIPLLETIKSRLSEENWESGTVTPPQRPTILSIRTKGKTLEEVMALYKRLADGEFGQVTVSPILAPEE